MNNDLPVSLLIAAFSGALMLLIPHISPRRYFFAITVPAGFRSSVAARNSLHRYYAAVVCGLVIAVAALMWLPMPGELLPVAGMFIPAAFGMPAFLWQRNQVARIVPPPGQIREADLSADDDHLPRWIVLALPPFAFPLAAAAWLRAHWDRIPARFPIHWDINNVPNGWADKSTRAVFGPVIFAGGLMLLLILLTLAMFYGSRRGRQRNAITQILVATIYFLALLFSAIAIMPVVQLSPLVLVAPGILFPLLLIIWVFRMVRDPNMPVDQTPDDCWYLGSLYVNRKDPAIFVQKRIGFGYTINLGNRLGWVFMGVFVAVMVGLIYVVPG